MAIKLPSHLHRSRSGILYFRIAIPPDLRHHFASREIYRSLRTPNVRDAASAAQALSAAFKQGFRRLRQETMPKTNNAPHDALAEIDFGLTLEINFDEFQRPQSAKLQTDANDTPEAIRAAVEALATAGAGASSVCAAKGGTQVLSAYVDAYLDSFPRDQRPNDKSLLAYRVAINTFIKIVGDKPLHELAIKDQNRFEDVIVKYLSTAPKWLLRAACQLTKCCCWAWSRSVCKMRRISHDGPICS
jgi:hypothetical protein